MLFAVPLVILFLGACWFLLYRFTLDAVSRQAAVSLAAVDEQYNELGPDDTRPMDGVVSILVHRCFVDLPRAIDALGLVGRKLPLGGTAG